MSLCTRKGVTSCNMILSLQTASMARPLHIEFPDVRYHITSRSNARPRGENHKMFLTTLAWVVARFSWRCHAYS